jgi:Viral coat protein P2 N-terminal domain
MPRVDQKMPAANAITAGQTATFRLPIGRRYHMLYLIGAGTGFDPTDLTEIRVLVNGKVIMRSSGGDRDKINQFDGRLAAALNANAFNLVIPFDRFGILTRAGEEETALNTGSQDPQTGKVINSLSLELDILAGTTVSSLDLYATTSEQIPGGPGTVPYLLKSTRDFTASQEYDIADLPRGGVATQFIDAVYMKPSTSTLDNLKVWANQYTVFERTTALNERAQTDGIRVPIAGWYNIDRTEHGYGGDPFDLRGLDDWRVKVTPAAAMSLTMYVKYLGTLGD